MEFAVRKVYEELLDGWNRRGADAMAKQFTLDGELIGFDGSHIIGRQQILEHLNPIFRDHPTPPFIHLVKKVQLLSNDVAIIRAIVGMVPPGETVLNPQLNAHQTVIATRSPVGWQVTLLQNTPAQFHGRPELVEQMTTELTAVLNAK